MNRITLLIAAGPIVVALALLGILLLISTQPGDAAARGLDLSLRQASELAPRIVSTSARALSGTTVADPAGLLGELDAAFERRLRIANAAFAELRPLQPGLVAQSRGLAQTLFDSIDPDAGQGPGVTELRAQFAAVNATAAVFRARTDGVRQAHERWLRLDRFVAGESRRLVGELRAGGRSEPADVIFRSAEQLRERMQGGIEMRPSEADQLIAAMVERIELDSEDDQARFTSLVNAMRELRPARGALISAESSLEESPLPVLLAQLRSQVGVDLLARLSTIGDAQVLLNVYTALLLVVLIYFAIRLRSSYAQLNRSHEDLEARVVERTRDLVQVNEDLKESQVQLVQAEKMSSLGQLVAGVMHEINTPLMYVRSNVETCADNIAELATEFGPAVALARDMRGGEADKATMQKHLAELRAGLDPDEIDMSLEEIEQLTTDTQDGLEQISELVQSLKDFSRLDRADQDWFDVRDGLDKTLTITRNLLKYGVEVTRDFAEVPKIKCTPSRLNQVFINLVTNAVQAMDGKGRIDLATRDLGNFVEISVTDSGCGIPEEHLASITDPFFTTKPVGQGTGLGLSIVRQIIDEHGGTLDISSVPDVGTTMTVTLPVQHEAVTPSSEMQSEEAA